MNRKNYLRLNCQKNIILFTVFFVEYIDKENRKEYEIDYFDESTQVLRLRLFLLRVSSKFDGASPILV
ncbi:hypothetical protein GMMP15_1860012 [Candidatus Magnetomoraceae bacterium gMMP-15]